MAGSTNWAWGEEKNPAPALVLHNLYPVIS